LFRARQRFRRDVCGNCDRPFRAQIYWRLVDDETGGGHRTEPFAALELIVSVQTSRLDSDTSLAVARRSPASNLGECSTRRTIASRRTAIRRRTICRNAKARAVIPSCPSSTRPIARLLFVSANRIGPSYIEMVHPADFRQTTFDGWPIPRRSFAFASLFAERLEKGVILRSRIRGLFIARSHDTETARTEYRRFAASEPPLTA